MAVCLRLAAGGSVAGVGESALRALSKLDQVMPSRLRSQVSAVHDATVTLTWSSSDSPVEPDVLMTLARACRDREHVSASLRRPRRQRHRAAARAVSARHHRKALVSAGFRPRPRRTGAAFGWTGCRDVRHEAARSSRRDAPDAAAYVRRSISASPYRHVARVRYFAPEQVVAQHFSPSSVTIEADGPDACIVTAGADDPERMVFYFATVGCRLRGARTTRGGRRRRVGRRAAAARRHQAVTSALGSDSAQPQAQQQQPAVRLEPHRQRVRARSREPSDVLEFTRHDVSTVALRTRRLHTARRGRAPGRSPK